MMIMTEAPLKSFSFSHRIFDHLVLLDRGVVINPQKSIDEVPSRMCSLVLPLRRNVMRGHGEGVDSSKKRHAVEKRRVIDVAVGLVLPLVVLTVQRLGI